MVHPGQKDALCSLWPSLGLAVPYLKATKSLFALKNMVNTLISFHHQRLKHRKFSNRFFLLLWPYRMIKCHTQSMFYMLFCIFLSMWPLGVEGGISERLVHAIVVQPQSSKSEHFTT